MSSARPDLLLTGPTGFLGRHVLEQRSGAPTAVLVRSRDAFEKWPWAQRLTGVQLVLGDILEPSTWRNHPALTEVRSVLHLAAHVEHSRRAREQAFRTNVDGTLAMLDVAAKLGARLVFVSTSGTVGCFASASERADEDAPACEARIRSWPYYASKLEAERKATLRAAELATPLTIVRAPVLLGPGDHRLRSSSHILRVLDGRIPFQLPGGIAVVDVRDVAAALLEIAKHPSPRPVYHLPGWDGTLRAFFEAIARSTQRSLPRWGPPRAALLGLARLLSSAPALQVRLGLPDPVLLEMGCCYWGLASRYSEADLSHRPRDITETLSDAIAWLRREGHIPAVGDTR